MNKQILNKDKKKTTKGITLIALVITIIVLLILAGVSIATLTGDNGILTQATNAKETSQIEEIIEKARVDILGAQAQNDGKISEEELNTILEKYGDISGEDEQKVITTDKGYVIKVTDIYSGTLTNNNGKTIAELYDGINNSTDEEYNNDAMHIGDYVNYDAGEWNETNTIPTENYEYAGYRFKFGGYMQGQSRNTNATGMFSYYEAQIPSGNKEGWRIWDISDDKKTMTLISAGCPETFLYEAPNEWDEYKYNYENILTGNTNGETLDSYPYEPRIWDMYVNSKQYATNARTVTKSDMDNWYKKYINSSIEDTYNVILPNNTENKIISTFANGSYYWIATIGDNWNEIYCVNPNENKLTNPHMDFLMPYNYGIRVLVTLSTDVKFNKTPQKVEGTEHDGFVYNKWEIVAK